VKATRKIIILLVAGLAIVTTSTACFEDQSTFNVTVQNDTANRVVLKQCSNRGCTRFRNNRIVLAGRAVSEPYADTTATERWAVFSRNRRIGCFAIRHDQKVEYVLRKISRLSQCADVA